MTLKTRKPTGLVPWPLILVEGSEKSGKSWCAAALSASPRVGRTFWIDLGEGAADEYGAIPGARYEIVEHDGTWASIHNSVEAVRDIAAKAAAAKEAPVVLVIDSMTAEWDLLKDWISNIARERLAKKGRSVPAGSDVQISMDLWNSANGRHRKLMTLLMTFPGIAVVTARGKEVAALDSNGRPIEGSKEYKVEGQKNLAFDATVWVRMSRTEHPTIIGARSVHAGIKPGSDKPRAVAGLTLERLVFDVLKCNPSEAVVRDLTDMKPGSDEPPAPDGGPPNDQDAVATPRTATARPTPSKVSVHLFKAIGEAKTLADLKAAFDLIGPSLADKAITPAEADQLTAHVRNRKAEVCATTDPAPATGGAMTKEHRDRSMKRMHAQWRDLGMEGETNRLNRLAKTSEVVGREINSSTDLTDNELADVINWQAAQPKTTKAEAKA